MNPAERASMLNTSTKSAHEARTPKQSGRQRSKSGTGLLSKLGFLRLPTITGSPSDKQGGNGDDGPSQGDETQDLAEGLPVDPRRALELDRPEILELQESYLKRTRKRAGSLRKTALLGTRKLINEQRLSQPKIEQQDTPAAKSDRGPDEVDGGAAGDLDSHGEHLDAGTGLRKRTTVPSSDRALPGSIGTHRGYSFVSQPGSLQASPRASLSSSRLSDGGSISDGVTSLLSRRSTSSTVPSTLSGISSQGLGRQSKHGRKASPLSLPPQSHDASPHGYETTARFGALILVVTWLIFVIGMGSCLDVWSWAWDVGETPYAPPELEDDETLPITGYYPALLVCTAIMSWVWVTSAWIGMKYFKHARGVVTE